MANFTAAFVTDNAKSLPSGERFADKIHIGFLLKWGVMNAGIATVARASNVATITTTAAHGMLVGQYVDVNATTDNTFDANGASSFATVLSVPSTTSFTYASTGTDKAQTADSGALSSWEVVNDSGHGSVRNCRLHSITTSSLTIQWDNLPTVGTWKLSDATLGNHQNNSSAIYTPFHGAVGLTNCSMSLRYRQTIFGRCYWNGTTTGGGVTSNNNWVKEGDAESASFVGTGVEALNVGHNSVSLPTAGSRGASSFAMPDLQQSGNGVTPILPNFQASPFTATAYRPATNGFWLQFVDASGTIMNQAALEAISPASRVGFMWSRTVDHVINDHRRPPSAVTVFCAVDFFRSDL